MNNRPTILHLPGHLPYPITISSLLVNPDSPIRKHDGLLVYKFFAYETEVQDDDQTEKPVRKEMVEQFDSPWEGILTEWLVKEGTIVNSSNEPIISVIEPCLHEISFKDICAICGTDLSVRDYTGDVSTQPNISMSHDNFDVKVTYDEAARIEKQTLKRLLTSRKLSLIVDLDQTIIHATVDPTVGEWMQQPENPNYNAVKDVRPFQLEEGGHLGPCWYFIKVRPGLAEFLENVSKMYELHVYTMGTRAYANAVAQIVDPKGKYFGDRVLSRDESGSMARKSIERLFPVDQSMVAVIDDRGDVWGWQPNLVKVMPYDFFVGIGDINSSFLPKQVLPSVVLADFKFTPPPTPPPKFPPPKPPTPVTEEPSKPPELPSTESVTSDTPTIDSLVAITHADDPDLIRAQTSEQNAVLEAQQVERPLAAAQSALDAKIEELAASSSESESEDEELYGDKSTSHKSTPPPSPHKASLLRDDDDELRRLEGVLESVWREFYDAYRRSLEGMQREKQLVRLEGRGKSSTESGKVPDIRDIMSEMRRHVLEGVTLVFSGVIPLNVNWQTHDYTQLARQFGANVVNELSSSVTHIVAVRKNTAKVKDAMHRYPRSKIVHLNWLLMSASSWRRLDESSYLLDEPHSDAFSPPNGLDPLDTQAFLSSDDDDEDEALSLPSAGVANVRGETPESQNDDEDVDIGEIDWGDAQDWGAADEEVDEFLAELGEDAAFTTDESDNESVASNTSESRGRKRKRKRDSSREVSDADDSDTDLPSNDAHLRSRLAKRIHTANSRKSALSKMVVVASGGSKPSSAAASPNGSSHGRPSPGDAPASANGSAVDRDSADDGDAEDSDLDDWANEFEKELV